MDADHASRCAAIVSRKICAPSYIDIDMLRTLQLYDDVVDFIALQEPVYERLVWEFMSSYVVDFKRKFDDVRGYIRFRLFNHTHEMHLVQFNELLRLPVGGATYHTPPDYQPKQFWTTLTCLGRPYEARSTKATWICNPVIRYFHRLLANHVFPRADSQNGVRASELFMIWAALHRQAVNTGAFIADHQHEHAKSSKVVLSDGGIITALAKALGYGAQIASLPILHRPGRLDLATCLNMKLFTTHGGGPLWLNHHGRALFPFPNQPRTTVTNPENLIYDDEAAGEAGAHSDDGSDHGSTDEAEALPRARGGPRRAPNPPAAGPSHPSHPSPAGAMSPSVLQTVLDRLDQLHVQNQEILRHQQHMTHLVLASHGGLGELDACKPTSDSYQKGTLSSEIHGLPSYAMIMAQNGLFHFDHKPFIVKAWTPKMEFNTNAIASLQIWIQFSELDIKY
ncbi:hypothetical protein Cgig2_011785 [Carnegiea gigantea]|uniref:Arabidopsis retrotransposon Orf1 C-terminal domain-containing protein n=1 Tax=Carnegiea gigantea TaxID=171969 RepID=A0A9Q1Q5H6_9CARY|nr:hypothetical protein Cgig2_011785 [Carnegiea gigantea]